MALELRNLGVAGLVTDGLVRDAQEIRQLGLPVGAGASRQRHRTSAVQVLSAALC